MVFSMRKLTAVDVHQVISLPYNFYQYADNINMLISEQY